MTERGMKEDEGGAGTMEGSTQEERKKEIQHHNRVNKSFEKIPRFDGTNPAYCFDWLTQVEALVNDNEGRNY